MASKTFLLRSDTPLDTARAAFAAGLYNSVYVSLIEDDWYEEREPPSPFWPEGKPTGIWRHNDPKRAGSYSMDAAFVAHVQARPSKGE